MRFPRNTKVFRGQLDPAPYAGVFFLLVIFLLLNSSLVFTPGVPIHLPETVDLPGAATPNAVVAVDEGGRLFYQNQVIEEASLKQALRLAVGQQDEPLTLIVQADKRVAAEVLVRLALVAREAGIKQALLATRPPAVPLPAALAPSSAAATP